MDGIVFFKTEKLQRLRQFYEHDLKMDIWLEQADCIIFRNGNQLLGFCQRDQTDTEGMITLFGASRSWVDAMYERFEAMAVSPPQDNQKYKIYQCFIQDPDGRMIEFQHFSNVVQPSISGMDLLMNRRSIRAYRTDPVPKSVLNQLFELCRYAPTGRNFNGCYYKLIDDRGKLQLLADTRGDSSAPIAQAPMAVAVVTDPSVSCCPVEDGHIAAYHFLLAARIYHLGTCWIADMNKTAVKQIINIPNDHRIATVSPLGYPSEIPDCPARRPLEELLK